MKFLFTCVFSFYSLIVFSKDCEGYIIKNVRDTVKGTVDVRHKMVKIKGEEQPAF